MAETHQSILLDAPKEVDVTAIERELLQLWKHAAEGSTLESAPIVRACSLNLVILSEGADRAPGLEEIVSQITVDHPSRIFLISADRKPGTASIEAWVSARCSLPAPGGRQVCCEEINLVASGTDVLKAPSIVTSLLVPDVPTVLIWKARLATGDVILQLLTQLADRILIDSSEELRPVESLIEWGRFIEEHRRKAACGDLAWTHLTTWRTLLAQVFQPVDARIQLTTLDAVTIEFSSTRAPLHSGLSQSLLAAAWLAHSLQWTLVHPFKEGPDGIAVATFRKDDRSITVRLIPTGPRVAHAGGIESIIFHSPFGEVISLQSMERNDCILLSSSLPGSDPAETILSIHYQTEAELVSRELAVLYNDPLFESSMSVLASMLVQSAS